MIKHWLLSVAVAAVAAASSVGADDQPEIKLIFGEGAGAGVRQVPSDVLAEMGEYWVGLVCSQPDAALRAQLDLPEKQGLLVEEVAPDSPALKAGLKPNDVLVKANDKPLESVADLVKIINQVKDGKLTFELLRGGKKQTVEVTPAKRPPGARLPGLQRVPGVPKAQAEVIEKYIEKMLPGEAGKALRFQFVHPPTILPPGAAVPPALKLPDNMSITITREGSKPAKITVKEGDQQWEATEKELNKFPDKVRPYVERMLPPGRLGIHTFTLPVPPPGAEGKPGIELEHHPFVPRDMEKQLQDMGRQIEQLRKAVDELHGKPPAKEKP